MVGAIHDRLRHRRPRAHRSGCRLQRRVGAVLDHLIGGDPHAHFADAQAEAIARSKHVHYVAFATYVGGMRARRRVAKPLWVNHEFLEAG